LEALEVKHLTPPAAFPDDESDSLSQSWLSQHRRSLRLFVAVVSVTIIGVLLLGVGTRRAAAPVVSPPKTLAVLPFRAANPQLPDEPLETGIAETLISRLSGVSQIVVRPFGATRGYTDPQKDLVEAGHEVQADAVLDGTVENTGDRIKVSVRLLDVQHRKILWTDHFDENLADIFKIEDLISSRVTNALALRLSAAEQNHISKRYTNSAQAYQLFMRSEFLKDKRDYKKSFELYQQTLETDPNFALAYAGLADACLKLISEGTPKLFEKDALTIARASLDKALELDEGLAEAHSTLAEISYSFDYDWSRAEAEFKKAIDLNPNSAEIRLGYGGFLLSLARFENSMTQMRKARELDPNNLRVEQAIGVVYYFMRNYDESLKVFQRIVQVDPNYDGALWWIENNYQQKVMFAEALETAIQDGFRRGTLTLREAQQRKELFAESGWQGILRFRLAVEKHKPNSTVNHRKLAALYSQLGKRDEAFSHLAAAIDERDPFIIWLKIEPQYDSLRSDPRYRELLLRLNLNP
jgi:TolB-like protein